MSNRENFEAIIEEVFSYYRTPQSMRLYPRIGVVGNKNCLIPFMQGTKDWGLQAISSVCCVDDGSVNRSQWMLNNASVYKNYRALSMSKDVDIVIILRDCKGAFDIGLYSLENKKSVICMAQLAEEKNEILDQTAKIEGVFFTASRSQILNMPVQAL